MNPDSSQAALGQLQAIQAASQDPNSILSNQRQQLGVDNAQQTVTGLRGAINNTTKLLKQVAPSVMGRTASSLVNNAQATKQIQNEQAPISQNLAEQGTEYNQASQDLGQLQDRAREAASGIYQGQQDKLSYAQNLYNTLYKKEQDAAAAARAEADRQEQIRQFNAQQQAAQRQFDLTNNSGAGKSAPKTDPVQQAAYNDVQTRISKQSDAELQGDFRATARSAAKGNQKDKIKLDLYRQLRPDLFANSGQEAISNFSSLRF